MIQIQNWLGACNPIFKKIWIRIVISMIYLFLASSILIAFLLPTGQIRRILKLISNDWLGVFLYTLLAVLIADIVSLIRSRMIKHGNRNKQKTEIAMSQQRNHKFHIVAGGICSVVVLTLSAWGIYNARIIHTTPYEITVNKDGGKIDSLNVILISDLHLGYNIGISHISKMVEKINRQHADIVFIAGDIFDNEYEALENPEKLAEVLRSIQSKYGVYACYGNHDVQEKILAGFTFGGQKKKESSVQMDAFLQKAGIHLLRDESILIEDSFFVYGRPDAQRPGRGIVARETASELMKRIDSNKPVIVIDHQPREFKELADAGVDVCLSGHTHDGQMFPSNLITSFMWENSYGYMKKGNLHTIVTSGVGLFGPNMRVGTIAEICSIKIHFLPKK